MSDCEIVSTRLISQPQQKVFKAWSDPAHLKHWWGPNGFTNTIHEFDFRPEGKWVLTMHGPEKGHYENESVFVEIIEPELIIWNRLSNPKFQVAASFQAKGEQTLLIFKMIFATPGECAKVKKIAVNANEENFDRLEAELERMND